MIALANSFRGQGPLKQEQTLPESLQNQLLKLKKRYQNAIMVLEN